MGNLAAPGGAAEYGTLKSSSFTSLVGDGGALLDTSGNLSQLLNNIYIAGVGAVAVIAVVMIIWGGIQIAATGDNAGRASSGKEKIWNAVWGLLLALGSMVLLQTISKSFKDAEFLGGGAAGGNTEPYPAASAPAAGAPQPNRGPEPVPGAGPDGTPGTQPPFDGGGAPPGTLSTNSAGDYDNLSIAESTRLGMGFPNQDWNSFALQEVRNSGLLNLNPSDAARYFPNGPSAEGYVSLLASIAQSESSFNPTDNLDHSAGYDVGTTYSVGLFSLSEGDREVRNLGFSETDLGNPYNSIQAAVDILERQIRNTGTINGGNNPYWGPLNRGE